tara:strand:- start:1053 stop:1856 length:804 start_codon:yes stop_codon:yes gene_type:complete
MQMYKLVITSHHSYRALWDFNINSWLKNSFQNPIHIVLDSFDKQKDLYGIYPDINFHFCRGNWIERLFNYVSQLDPDEYILLSTDDIFVEDKNLIKKLNIAFEEMKRNKIEIFGLCYVYNRIYKIKRNNLGLIDMLSPHAISLKPTFYKTKVLKRLLTDALESPKMYSSAADFEISSSLNAYLNRIDSLCFFRYNSIKTVEAISKGRIKPDINKFYKKNLCKHFDYLNLFERINYFLFVFMKEFMDIFIPKYFLKKIIEKGYFWIKK